MFKFHPYINTDRGRTVSEHISLQEQKYDNGAVGVFVDAVCHVPNSALDSECGVLIELTPEFETAGFMANYRHTEFWCRPHFGSALTDIPDETQALIIKLSDGSYCAVVPVVNDTYKCVLRGTEQGFAARLFSWCEGLCSCKGLAFMYAAGDDPAALVECCVKAALKALNSGIRHRDERRYPDIFEYLGWCSWDSMQIRVSEDGLLSKCEEFPSKDIPVKWAILDDMWAEIRNFYGKSYSSFEEMVGLMHSSAMYHFEADPLRFPHGLKYCIERIKEYGLKVGMWHPTTGYWRGIEPDGDAYKLLKDYLMTASTGMLVPDWHSGKSYMYYKTIHDFFRKCGADFVKIDNQTMIRRYYKYEAPVGRVAREFHDGMEASVGEHFDGCMINCMGMGSEDMWSRTSSPVSRCSDDFQPENREWFTKHILQCAYNSLLQGQFYWCDWDMWWTDDGQAEKNSLMRAVSGGPIYVSDKIDRSRKAILDPLVLSDGRILRCDRPCTPTADCITEDATVNGHALKLQNTVGQHGVMAVLNIDRDDRPVTASISGAMINGFEADEYAVYEHFSREIRILRRGESFDITLSDSDDYRLYIFAPITNGFAPIGRVDKFISPKTIEYISGETIKLLEDGPYAYVKDGRLVIEE